MRKGDDMQKEALAGNRARVLSKSGSEDSPPMQAVHICGVKSLEKTSGCCHCKLWRRGADTQPPSLG